MRRLIIALAALATLAVSKAQPQPPPPHGGEAPGQGRVMRGNADTNLDGKVDEVEARQAAQQRLAPLKARMEEFRRQFDTDGDGTLNAQEQAALKNKLAERAGGAGDGRPGLGIIGMVDKDGDWKISPEEEKAAVEMMAQRILQGEGARGGPQRPAVAQEPDANGDCIIDDTEARLVAEKRVESARKMIERLRARAQEDPNAPYPPMAAELDTDRNYEVSDAEAGAAVQRLMADMQKRNAIVMKYFDTDKDGALSAAELPAAKTAFAFMNEVRPERGEMGPGPQLRDRPGRNRGPGANADGRRQPERGGEPLPPPPPDGGGEPPPPPPPDGGGEPPPPPPAAAP
jgi:hypothetical protein